MHMREKSRTNTRMHTTQRGDRRWDRRHMLTKTAQVEGSLSQTPFLKGRIAPTSSQMLELSLLITQVQTLHRFKPQFLIFPICRFLL